MVHHSSPNRHQGKLVHSTVLLVSAASIATAAGPLPSFSGPRGVNVADQFEKPQLSMEHVASWGGPVNDFKKVGNTGYVAAGERLVILDLADPSDMVELGAVRMGSLVHEVVVLGGYAYVVTNGGNPAVDAGFGPEVEHRSRFQVVDVSNPANPTIVWQEDSFSVCSALLPWDPRGIDVDGDYAWIEMSSGNEPSVWDISDPAQPRPIVDPLAACDTDAFGGIGWRYNELDVLEVGFNRPAWWTIRDGLLYVVREKYQTSGVDTYTLHIYDIANMDTSVAPTSNATRWRPAMLGAYDFPQGYEFRDSWECAISDGIAYIQFKDNQAATYGAPEYPTIWSVDISDPANPTALGMISANGNPGGPDWDPRKLRVGNGRLYSYAVTQLHRPSQVLVYDIASDPAHPALDPNFYTTNGSVFDIVPDGDILYVQDMGEGLLALDMTNYPTVTRLDNYHSPAQLTYADRRGDLLYVGDEWNGISILNVADPSDPQLVGVYTSPQVDSQWMGGLAVDDDGYAYFGAGIGGLEIVDVSNPAAPTLASVYDLASGSYDAEFATTAVSIGISPMTGLKSVYAYPLAGNGPGVSELYIPNPSSVTLQEFWFTRSSDANDSPRVHLPLDQSRGMLYLPWEDRVGSVPNHVWYDITGVKLNEEPDGDFALEGAVKTFGNDEALDIALDLDDGILWYSTEYDNNANHSQSAIIAVDVSNPTVSAPRAGIIEFVGGIGDSGFPVTGGRVGAIAMHECGLVAATSGYTNFVFDGIADNLPRLLLIDTEDPNNPQLLAAAHTTLLNTNSQGDLQNNLITHGSDIYLLARDRTATFGIDESVRGTGLSIYTVSEALQLRADVTGPGGVGDPDGTVTTDDLSFFVNAWIAADTDVADVTGVGGEPDGALTYDDIRFFVSKWLAEHK